MRPGSFLFREIIRKSSCNICTDYKAMNRFEYILGVISRWFNWIAAAALVIMMLVVCANVIGRSAFSAPVKGTVDLVGYLGAFVLAWALAYTQLKKGNICIEILMLRLSQRVQNIVDIIVYFISFALFVIISWQAMKYTFITWEGALRSEVLKIPTGPFMLVVALGCIALTLILLMDFLRSVNKVVKK